MLQRGERAPVDRTNQEGGIDALARASTGEGPSRGSYRPHKLPGTHHSSSAPRSRSQSAQPLARRSISPVAIRRCPRCRVPMSGMERFWRWRWSSAVV